jgi:hypothetical protein
VATEHPDLRLTWATYTPNSIVGICSLCDGGHWACVSAGGEVCLWDGAKMVHAWDLPEAGSPRSLAAHPDRPWIAVGIKKGGFARPQSAVVLVEAMPARFDPVWRTATAVRISQAVQEQCSSSQGPIDPVALAVLADALEESGCDDLDLLAHLRYHDRRLRAWYLISASFMSVRPLAGRHEQVTPRGGMARIVVRVGSVAGNLG